MVSAVSIGAAPTRGGFEGRAGDPLVAASADAHAWIVVPTPDDPTAWHLLHHAPDMPRDGMRLAEAYASRPEAVAAWGERVWIVFPPGEEGRRDVIGFRTLRNPAFETWFNDPPAHPDLLPSLPGGAELRSLVGTERGPVALLASPANERQPVRAVPPRPLLLRLAGAEWLVVEPPADAGDASRGLLGAAGGDPASLVLVTMRDAEILVHARDPERGAWSAWPANGLVGRPVALATVGRMPMLAVESEGTVALAYLRPQGPLELARIAPPPGAWRLLGMGDDALVASFTNRFELELRPIDAVTGSLGEAVVVGDLRPRSEQWLHVPILGIVVVGAVMLLLMFRGDAIVEPAVEGAVAPLDLGVRMVALLIDYVPAAAVALLLTRCEPIDLVVLPIWTVRFEQAMPPLLAIALTCAHGAVAEAATGRSLGKRLVGGRVARLDGGRPGPAACLARGALKFLVLSMPVVGVFVLMNANRRGMPELATGTIVATTPSPD